MEAVEKPQKPNLYTHLIPNDLAESILERAESLSEKGRTHESIQAFQQAATLFAEIESFLKVRDWEVEDQGERELIDKTRDAARLKRKYCLTRINMESRKLKVEADNVSSVEKYPSTKERFEEL